MARLIEVSKIRVQPKRQRLGRSQEQHQELLTSIAEGEAGLLHAPVLWVDGEGLPWLVAGEGRLNAVKEMYDLGMVLRYEGQPIPDGMIPYTLIGEVSPAGLYEAEYDENMRRAPLTMAEQVEATARLFELKQLIAEAKGEKPPTVADLSVELRGSSVGSAQDQTRKELIIARHLDDAEVRAAPSVREAFNIVKKKETRRKAVELAQSAGGQVMNGLIALKNMDCREWFKTAPEGEFDLVLCDPPYGMGADTFGQYNASDEHRYDDSYEAWQELMPEVLAGMDRVCKPNAHVYLFCDFERFSELRGMVSAYGWQVFRTPLIWHNPVGFRTPWIDSGPQRKYECILYAKRGEKKVLKVLPDVLTYARDKEGFHAAAKPIALMADLLARSALPTDHVLDFCMGSGSAAVAAKAAKLRYTGIEIDEVSFGHAMRRVGEVK